MKYKARAPLRLRLAGGGTDVSPYADLYNGMVVNATIDLYATVTVERLTKSEIQLTHGDSTHFSTDYRGLFSSLLVPPPFDLHIGVLQWLYEQGVIDQDQGIRIHSDVDVPLGSGLGTSSTLVVSLIGALLEALHLEKLDPAVLGALAFDIERNRLGLVGGKQDQYAASFGGINALYFEAEQKVRVEPLHPADSFIKSLGEKLVLYYSAHSRFSSVIIEEQIKRTQNREPISLNAMHALKIQAMEMLEGFRSENFERIAQLLDNGFHEKKKMASGISTDSIEALYPKARSAGALAGKISGAGGGGFMLFFTDPANRKAVTDAISTFGGQIFPFSFTNEGMKSWVETE